ncbi:MAG: hypothetical protein NBV65_05040 [Burkholderiaceae bacterium]|nr:hypothetical protein [Burkholderiaceae bacterium]
MTALRDTTGGLRWHWRAFVRLRRWRDTTRAIADWLDGTQPAHRELLLIGGSAGWMMSGRWLQRFDRIVLVDIDPHAAWLFRLNHGRRLRASGTRLAFVQADGLARLESLLAAHPQASVFFDNVLGQHLYRVGDLEVAERELDALGARLAGRDWGSVHDLFSGPVDPAKLPASPLARFDALRDAGGLAVDGLRDTPLHLKLLAQVGGAGDWMDHLTSGVFPPGTYSRLIAWPFLPTYAHWLQAGWVAADR